MNNLYFELTNIVGKSPLNDSVLALLSKMAEQPAVDKTGCIERLCFRHSGFIIHVNRMFEAEIKDIFLFCNIPECWQEELRAFSSFVGDLPSGIIINDNRDTVSRKLSMKPSESTEPLKQLYFAPDFTDEEVEASYVEWKEKCELPGFERLHSWDRYVDALPFSDVVDYYVVNNYALGFRFLRKTQTLLGVHMLRNFLDDDDE